MCPRFVVPRDSSRHELAKLIKGRRDTIGFGKSSRYRTEPQEGRDVFIHEGTAAKKTCKREWAENLPFVQPRSELPQVGFRRLGVPAVRRDQRKRCQPPNLGVFAA